MKGADEKEGVEQWLPEELLGCKKFEFFNSPDQ